MDTKFWTLFRSRSSINLDAHSYRYSDISAGKAPVVGELPVRGNGPSILDLYRQGKNADDRSERQDRIRRVLNDEPASPPAVPRMRIGESIGKKGDTSKEGGISRKNSTKSLARRLSIKSIASLPRPKSTVPKEKRKPVLQKGKSSPDLKSETRRFSVSKAAVPVLSSHFDYNKFDEKPLPSIPKSKPKTKARGGKENEVKGHHERKSTHIDLFDAVQAQAQAQASRKAVPKRNYGEDVADRNLTMYVPENRPTSVAPQSRRTSGDSRHQTHQSHSRGTSDGGVAYNWRDESHLNSPPLPPDADWLNQPWVKQGQKPWEEARRSSRPRSTRSVKSLRMDVEKPQENWPIRTSSGTRSRSKNDAGDKQIVPDRTEKRQQREPTVAETVESSTDDDSFELGAVTVSDDIFYPG